MALALVDTEPNCRYTDVNIGFAALLSYSTFELVGRRSASILAQDDQLRWIYERRWLVEGRIDHLYQVHRYVVRGGKEYINCQCWCWLLRKDSDQGAAVLCTFGNCRRANRPSCERSISA